jgi:hypothetical protein
MSRNINDAQLQELHRWQKWVLADRMAQHGVTVLSQEPDGGIVLGKGAVTARIPGAATVAQALRGVWPAGSPAAGGAMRPDSVLGLRPAVAARRRNRVGRDVAGRDLPGR